MAKHRPIYLIAADIKAEWKNVHDTAAPYLNAMMRLNTIDDNYGLDRADGIIARFLNNARTFRGGKAADLKKELKVIAGIK